MEEVRIRVMAGTRPDVHPREWVTVDSAAARWRGALVRTARLLCTLSLALSSLAVGPTHGQDVIPSAPFEPTPEAREREHRARFQDDTETSEDGPERPQLSLRSQEFLRRDCYNALGREELTLFGNGTVRLRAGSPAGVGALDETAPFSEKSTGQLAMWLHELGPSERDAFVARLQEIDLSESDDETSSVTGSWVERCELHLAVPERKPRSFSYHRYDSLSLALRRVVEVAESLLGLIERHQPSETAQRLPSGFRAEVGDLLTRADGELFRVQFRASGGASVELRGENVPVTLYLPESQLRQQFIAVERRP